MLNPRHVGGSNGALQSIRDKRRQIGLKRDAETAPGQSCHTRSYCFAELKKTLPKWVIREVIPPRPHAGCGIEVAAAERRRLARLLLAGPSG